MGNKKSKKIPSRIAEINDHIFDEIFLQNAMLKESIGQSASELELANFIYAYNQEVRKATSQPAGNGLVLEVGCNIGTLSRALGSVYSTQQVIGIDIDSRAIGQGNMRYQKPQNVSLRNEDAHDLSAYHGKVGILVIYQTLHHLELEKMCDEIYASLNHTGLAVILDFDRSRIGEQMKPKEMKELYNMRQSMTDEQCMERFKQEGFFDCDERTFKLAKNMSIMAAYTGDEVISALKKRDLLTLKLKPSDAGYIIHVAKALN